MPTLAQQILVVTLRLRAARAMPQREYTHVTPLSSHHTRMHLTAPYLWYLWEAQGKGFFVRSALDPQLSCRTSTASSARAFGSHAVLHPDETQPAFLICRVSRGGWNGSGPWVPKPCHSN
ncbi:hypothetical protein HOY82DRAFT_183388 [Tuber indicum]|nr:hypothetical protein HOY82DRAFT_183388 [Tuber indicum]